MTKEQEEAIEYLNYMEKHIGFNRIGYVYGNDVIKTVLSLLSEQEKELQALKDFEEIANSKVTELNPIRISKSKSIDK